MAALFVAFEGGEACGKTTQAHRLSERLGAVLTREPGGTAIGERIRALLLDPDRHEMHARAEVLLMAADRAQHIAEVVRPALAAGTDVVSDRSGFSSIAYQGHGRGIDLDEVHRLSDWASGGLWPDVVILLDVPAPVAASRRSAPPDRMEEAGAEFHGRVLDGFRTLAAADPDRWLVVDGAGSVDDVACRVGAAFDAWRHHGG